MRFRSTAVILAAVSLLLMGADSCQDQGGQRGAGPPPTVPEPNPDNGPPQFPGVKPVPSPKPADPNAADYREFDIHVSWSPAVEFVQITWKAGRHGDKRREVSGGRFDRHISHIRKGDTVSALVEWTEMSHKQLIRTGTNGRIIITLLVSDKVVCGPKEGSPIVFCPVHVVQ